MGHCWLNQTGEELCNQARTKRILGSNILSVETATRRAQPPQVRSLGTPSSSLRPSAKAGLTHELGRVRAMMPSLPWLALDQADGLISAPKNNLFKLIPDLPIHWYLWLVRNLHHVLFKLILLLQPIPSRFLLTSFGKLVLESRNSMALTFVEGSLETRHPAIIGSVQVAWLFLLPICIQRKKS